MASPISPTLGPTIISSVGPAISNGPNGLQTASLAPSQISFITNLPTSPTTTFGFAPSSTGASSSLAPSSITPSSLASSSSPINSADANNGNSNSQGYPIGLIAGVVTGFSILMLVMGVLFVVLWRNKRTKDTSDTEASQMRGPRAAIPFYYVPPPPTQDDQQQLLLLQQQQQQQQQKQKGIESGASTPVKSARFAPESEMMMTPPSRLAMASPRRIEVLNKPWPATPRDAQGLVQTTSTPPQPLHEDASSTPIPASLSFPGYAVNHPDPLRADGLVQPPTGARAVHFTPVKANLIHNRPPSSSHSSEREPRESYTQNGISPSSTIPGSDTTAPIRSTITADYEQTLRRHFRRFSGLVRSDSTAAHALSPPPRRPKTGDSEAASSTGEGKLSGPGLRLSGVDQGSIGQTSQSGEGQRESMTGDETDQRVVW